MTAGIELFGDLEAVEIDADGGLDRAEQPSLFNRLDWFRLLARHCPPEGRLMVVRARDGRGVAWLFLAIHGRQAEAYSAWYSLRVDVAGERRPDVMTSIATALRDQGLARIVLAPIEDPAALAAGFEAAGWKVLLTPDKANWRIETKGMDFETYWAARPARLRNTARRRAKAAGLDIVIHDHFSPQGWADYESVYRASWKPEEGSFPFLRALAEQEGAAGTLRLGLAYKDRRPVAAQLWLVENGEATIHKLAYVEDLKAMSPGTILSMAMFRQALDSDHVSCIDYGTGDEGYKADWMGERRMLWKLTAHNPGTLTGLVFMTRASLSKLAARLRSR